MEPALPGGFGSAAPYPPPYGQPQPGVAPAFFPPQQNFAFAPPHAPAPSAYPIPSSYAGPGHPATSPTPPGTGLGSPSGPVSGWAGSGSYGSGSRSSVGAATPHSIGYNVVPPPDRPMVSFPSDTGLYSSTSNASSISPSTTPASSRPTTPTPLGVPSLPSSSSSGPRSSTSPHSQPLSAPAAAVSRPVTPPGLIPFPVGERRAVLAIIRKNTTEGLLNKLRAYKTYTLGLHKADYFFAVDPQNSSKGIMKFGWNRKYDKAQQIFGKSAKASLVRRVVHATHHLLYNMNMGSLHPEDQRYINSGAQFLEVFKFGQRDGKDVKYTYVIMPQGTFHFSQTDAAGSPLDGMSKHAVQANAEPEVLYAGEFRVMQRNGQHVLVIDNGSGTFAPNNDRGELARLKALFVYNFPGLKVLPKLYDQDLDESAMATVLAEP